MESCYLDQSSFEVISKHSSRPPTFNKDNSKFLVCKDKMNQMEIYQSILSSDLEMLPTLCGNCVNELSTLTDSISDKIESDMNTYEKTLQTLRINENKYIEPSFPDPQHESIFVELSNEIRELETTLAGEQIRLSQIEVDIQEELRILSMNEYQSNHSADDLQQSTTILQSTTSEMMYYSKYSSSMLFTFQFMRNKEEVCQLPLTEDNHISHIRSSTDDDILTRYTFNHTFRPQINGLRVSFYTIPVINLNWSEINASWACISLAVTGVMSRHNLAEDMFSYCIRPLRRRCFLLRNSCGSAGSSGGSSGGREASVGSDGVLCLEGGRVSGKRGGTRGRSNEEEYRQAVMALVHTVGEVLGYLLATNENYENRYDKTLKYLTAATTTSCTKPEELQSLSANVTVAVWLLLHL